MYGCLVTGTDTSVGKTVLAGAICASLHARGTKVAAFKPVVTGTGEGTDPDWPPDHELLASICGQPPEQVAPRRFPAPVAPHLASQMSRRAIDPAALIELAQELGEQAEVLVVEGIGGLLVPLTLGFSVRDFARALRLPVVIVARAGVGTINHTLLTLEAARAAGLAVSGVTLGPWPRSAGAVERSNRDTIARLGRVRVTPVPRLPNAHPVVLAEAGAQLPLQSWLGEARPPA